MNMAPKGSVLVRQNILQNPTSRTHPGIAPRDSTIIAPFSYWVTMLRLGNVVDFSRVKNGWNIKPLGFLYCLIQGSSCSQIRIRVPDSLRGHYK